MHNHSTVRDIQKNQVNEISYLRTKQHNKLNHRSTGLHTNKAYNKEGFKKNEITMVDTLSFQVNSFFSFNFRTPKIT